MKKTLTVRPLEERTHASKIKAAVTSDEQRGERVAFHRYPLGLTQRLADQPSRPQRKPPGDRGVGVDRLPYRGDHEIRLTPVGEYRTHQLRRLRINESAHLQIEIPGDTVADVDLDQALPPVTGGGVLVKGVDRLDERCHRLLWIGIDVDESLRQPFELTELSGGDRGCLRLLSQGGCHRRIRGHAGETLQFAVRQQPEKINHRGTVFRVIETAALHDRPA